MNNVADSHSHWFKGRPWQAPRHQGRVAAAETTWPPELKPCSLWPAANAYSEPQAHESEQTSGPPHGTRQATLCSSQPSPQEAGAVSSSRESRLGQMNCSGRWDIGKWVVSRGLKSTCTLKHVPPHHQDEEPRGERLSEAVGQG